MEERMGAWVDVYPFNGRELIINNTGKRMQLSDEVSAHCRELWAPKAEKDWKSSWVAYTDKVLFDEDVVRVMAGSMPFSEIDGLVKAIGAGKSFAPAQGFVNCLSVGFPTATKDGKIIFQRRAPDVNCPNILIHEPCGYMASMNFAPRAECDNPKYASDPRLFDIKEQYDCRARDIAKTFGVDPEAVSYDLKQDFLACGWMSKEMYFSTSGRIDVAEKDLKIPERGEFFFVPFEYIKELIHNQGWLSSVNPDGYRPSNPREIPLIDESLVGLIWGYERMTGEKLDIQETVDRLNDDGLSINLYNTSSAKGYEFPSHF